jgi:hypothetical protein
LAGISIPIGEWKYCDNEISKIKGTYDLIDNEIHTSWIMRKYIEQSKIPRFTSLSYKNRRIAVNEKRKEELYKLQRGNSRLYKQTIKNYRSTDAYIHLTHDERKEFINNVAKCISKWSFARLFAECIDKIHFDPIRSTQTIDEQSFEQVVSRFEQYLESIPKINHHRNYGLLIHDNNETVCKKHTALMKKFHDKGTLWTQVTNIIETPLFVDSELTSMVQIADLCGYSIRRYLENNERDLFNLIYKRADRKGTAVVGVRHYTKRTCTCEICKKHRP